MTFQATVEGNSNRSTVGCPQDFVDLGRRWGTDEMDAQVLLVNQCDNILHHVMWITAAMEAWPSQTPGSSSSLDGGGNDTYHRMEEEPTVASCSAAGEDSHEVMNATEENRQAGSTGETEAHPDQKRKQEE